MVSEAVECVQAGHAQQRIEQALLCVLLHAVENSCLAFSVCQAHDELLCNCNNLMHLCKCGHLQL